MSAEIWLSKSGETDDNFPPSPVHISPIRNTRYPSNKPYGGMWTAPSAEDGGSAWTRWCIGEDYLAPPFHLYELHVNEDARVAVVDSFSDLVALTSTYGISMEIAPLSRARAPWRVGIDWERFASDYDALRLTDRGQSETHLSAPSLYGWDCASTLWTRWMFNEVIDLGEWTPAQEKVSS